MGLLIVDQDRCRKDGICAQECPIRIIGFADDGFPQIAPQDEGYCIVCGHCVAVCPHGALSHSKVPIEDCPAIRQDLALSEDQAVQFLRSRRSIRVFQDRPVEKEKILGLIEIARYAPTAGNYQLLEWTVLTDTSKINEIARLVIEWLRTILNDTRLASANPYLPLMVRFWDTGHDPVLRRAPVLVVASAPREDLNGMTDLTLALSYLDLAAPTMGLGTCWAGLLQGALLAVPQLREIVGIPEKHPHYYGMMVGYPEITYHRLPRRRPPKITFR